MALRYACYLSYQRGNDLVDRFARELFHTLSDELGLVTNLPVWFDTGRIEAGDSWNQALADALASSVCLVPILTPTYFERLYCSQEFFGMRRLEAMRTPTRKPQDSLIIPVVLRGKDRLPQMIQQTQFVDFSDYLAFGPKQFRSQRFTRSVAALGRQIAALCDKYADVSSPPSEGFVLPSEAETRTWLEGVESTPASRT